MENPILIRFADPVENFQYNILTADTDAIHRSAKKGIRYTTSTITEQSFAFKIICTYFDILIMGKKTAVCYVY